LRLFRTILAMMVAWSVVMAPTAGTFAAPSAPGAPAGHPAPMHSGEDAAAFAHAHHAGGHHAGEATWLPDGCCAEEDGAPAPSLPGDCSTLPGCVLKCFSVVPFATATLAVPLTRAAVFAWQASRAIHPDPPAPPFHPPRS
jgi:hypothetical protein